MQSKKAAELSRNDLTSGNIVKKLLLFALPIIGGNIVQQLYNVVDTIVVGNFVGPDAIAAVSVSFPVMMMFNAIFMGLSMGANIVISQKQGAGDSDALTAALTTTVSITIYGGTIITVLGLFFARPMLELLKTPANIIDDSTSYLFIVFIGTVGNMLYNTCNGAARGMGDSKWAFYVLAISSVTNIVLDLVFVVAFGWGVMGVAIATTLAHILSGAIMFYRIASGKYLGRIDLKRIGRIDKDIMRTVLRLGIPSSIQSAASSIGSLLVQTYSNMFGSAYISANSIAVKIDGFAIMPIMGLGMAITTFVGQNIGAGNEKRADEGLKKVSQMILVIGITLGIILSNFGYYIMRLFTDDAVVLSMAGRGLKVLAITYCFMGLNNACSGSMRGRGYATFPAIIAMFSTFARIPFAYFMAVKPLCAEADAAVAAGQFLTRDLALAAGVGVENNFMGMFWSMALTTILSAIIMVVYYYFGNWKKKAVNSAKRGPGPKGAPGKAPAPTAKAEGKQNIPSETEPAAETSEKQEE
ncbi:MAG: MATE family efflux transporter [Eubacteriaceae bacterium]|nr:MATE family efflux transporter [Eubacteriaceae bacterium]